MSDVNKPRRPEGIPPRDFPNKPNPTPIPNKPTPYPEKPIEIK
ncbi:hypothetical protein [Aquimarina sp. AU58]|nr:hypothetical protein [Aquimarina sp. AU58]